MKALKNHEIFENRAIKVIQKFPYNLQKCVSASSRGGYFHRFLSKAIITLPTWAEIVNLFEQTLIGGFSCTNLIRNFCCQKIQMVNQKKI